MHAKKRNLFPVTLDDVDKRIEYLVGITQNNTVTDYKLLPEQLIG